MVHGVTPRAPTESAKIARAFSSAVRRWASLAAGAALLTGCVILDLDGTSSGSGTGSGSTTGSGSGTSSSSGSAMGTSTPPLAPLPPPSIWRVELPVFDAEQQKRADEVEQYLAKQYLAQGWKIVETTQTFLGDIMDWLDPASVPADKVDMDGHGERSVCVCRLGERRKLPEPVLHRLIRDIPVA